MLDMKIETFLEVVKTKSYTATAAALHMTQPAVTQQIHKLEEYYNCQLIDSSHRSIHITKAGELLYSYLCLQQANEKQLAHLLNQTIDPLCMGASLSIADYYLPDIITELLLKEDERIRIVVENSSNLLDKLKHGDIDCALIEGHFDASLFETKIFCEEIFIPVVSSQHPFAHKEVDITMLQEYPLVVREPQSGTREILEHWLLQQNLSPKVFRHLLEIGSFTLIKEVVKTSNAFTFAYEGVVRKELHNGSLCRLAIKDCQITHPFLFVYRKGDMKQTQLLALFTTLFQQFGNI